jgi:copper chaperone
MVRFQVDKTGCGGGAKSVTRAVQAVEPGARVEVDLQAKLVIVSGISGPPTRSPKPSASPVSRPPLRDARPDRPRCIRTRPHGFRGMTGSDFRPGPEFGILVP